MEFLRESVEDYGELTTENCKNLIPIGDWGAGWGMLCLDLTKPEELAEIEK